jgi:signal transduction histidine kinase
MRPEEIPLALAPYRQVGEGRQSEGTGLGLPLVKAMTELHGGRLTMESTPDAGTTVTIWLSAERLLAPA